MSLKFHMRIGDFKHRPDCGILGHELGDRQITRGAIKGGFLEGLGIHACELLRIFGCGGPAVISSAAGAFKVRPLIAPQRL
jgi:hypothetical protein